jgi:hypothetical protein
MWCWSCTVYLTNNHDVHSLVVIEETKPSAALLEESLLATIIPGKHPKFAMAIYSSHLPPIWPLGSGGTQAINRLKPMIMHPMIQKLSE